LFVTWARAADIVPKAANTNEQQIAGKIFLKFILSPYVEKISERVKRIQESGFVWWTGKEIPSLMDVASEIKADFAGGAL